MSDERDGETTLPGVTTARQRRRAVSEQARVDQVDVLLGSLVGIDMDAGLSDAERAEAKREAVRRELHRAYQLGISVSTTAVEEAQALARSEQSLRQGYEAQLHDARFAVLRFLREEITQDVLREKVFGGRVEKRR